MADDDFSSLFDDDENNSQGQNNSTNYKSIDDEISSFIGEEKTEEKNKIYINNKPAVNKKSKEKIPLKKRSSQDFEPDMDILLITAQSPMIIEGMKRLSIQDFNTKSLPIYTEAVKGIELYIKILDRNPLNYRKLKQIISEDADCKEVENIAFNLYMKSYNDYPGTDDQKIRAFEILKDGLTTGYKKVHISKAIIYIKKYFLQSGSIDEYLINQLHQNNDPELKKDIGKMNQLLKYSISLIKSGKGEIAKGMKGKDLNVFIIKASELLYFYCNISGKLHEAKYFKRVMENHKKYFIIRD